MWDVPPEAEQEVVVIQIPGVLLRCRDHPMQHMQMWLRGGGQLCESYYKDLVTTKNKRGFYSLPGIIGDWNNPVTAIRRWCEFAMDLEDDPCGCENQSSDSTQPSRYLRIAPNSGVHHNIGWNKK